LARVEASKGKEKEKGMDEEARKVDKVERKKEKDKQYRREKRQEEAAMKKQIETCKTLVEKALAQRSTTEIKVGKYSVKKSMRTSEYVSKKDLPAEIWQKYAKTSEFSVLQFKAPASAAKPKEKAAAKKTTKKK